MSASFILSSPSHVAFDRCFAHAVCLSHGDNPRVLAARRVGDHDAASQDPQGDKPFLSIIETVNDFVDGTGGLASTLVLPIVAIDRSRSVPLDQR
jgi:hypothetical protein